MRAITPVLPALVGQKIHMIDRVVEIEFFL